MQTEAEKEISRLQKELADARMERDILKKAISIFSSSDRKNMRSQRRIKKNLLLRRCVIVSRLASMHFMTGSRVNRQNVSKGEKYCLRK